MVTWKEANTLKIGESIYLGDAREHYAVMDKWALGIHIGNKTNALTIPKSSFPKEDLYLTALPLKSYYHVFGIGTIDITGESVYIYIATFTSKAEAMEYVERKLSGTIFLYSSEVQNFRENITIGNMAVSMWTKKNGWRDKFITVRPLV